MRSVLLYYALESIFCLVSSPSGSFNLPSVTHSHRTCVRRASQYPCVRTVYDGQLLDLFSSHFTLFKQSPPGF